MSDSPRLGELIEPGIQSDTVDKDDLLGRSAVEATSKLLAVPPGRAAWVPITPARDSGFRAVRVVVLERATVGRYEEAHAICDWDEDAQRLYGGDTLGTLIDTANE